MTHVTMLERIRLFLRCRRENEPRGCARSRDLDVARPVAPPEIHVSGSGGSAIDRVKLAEKCPFVTGGTPATEDHLQPFACCRWCIKMVADGCRQRRKCLHQQYLEGPVGEGFGLSVILDAMEAGFAEARLSRDEMYRFADDGGPCHEAEP